MNIFEKNPSLRPIIFVIGILACLYFIILIIKKIKDLITIRDISRVLNINYKNRIPIVITTLDEFHLKLTGAVKDLHDRTLYPTKIINIVYLDFHRFELFFDMIYDTNYKEHDFEMVSCSNCDDPILFLYPKEIEFNPVRDE